MEDFQLPAMQSRLLFNYFNEGQVENNFLELSCSKRSSVMQNPHHTSKSWPQHVSAASQRWEMGVL